MVEIKIYNQCGSESNLWAIWEGEHFLATAEAVHWYREHCFWNQKTGRWLLVLPMLFALACIE